MPAKVLEDYLKASHKNEYSFADLTLAATGKTYRSPSGIALNATYINYLRRIAPRGSRFRMTAELQPIVVVADGSPIAVLMPVNDHGAPKGLGRMLCERTVYTAQSKGWDRLDSGVLLSAAEEAGRARGNSSARVGVKRRRSCYGEQPARRIVVANSLNEYGMAVGVRVVRRVVAGSRSELII